MNTIVSGVILESFFISFALELEGGGLENLWEYLMVRSRMRTIELSRGRPTIIIKSWMFLYIPCCVSFMHHRGKYFLCMFLRWWNIKGGILCEVWIMEMGKTMESGSKGKEAHKSLGDSLQGSFQHIT